MVDVSNGEPDCDFCGSLKGLSFIFLTKESIKEDGSNIPDKAGIVCRDHWKELIDHNEFYVRTIAPVPKERGGFSRTSDGQGDEILYDRSAGDSCWIQFDPETDEINLENNEMLDGETND